ncbi:hypothetical protein [Streptomyces fagopyri]
MLAPVGVRAYDPDTADDAHAEPVRAVTDGKDGAAGTLTRVPYAPE